MIEHPMTRHAERRTQQRSFRDADISVLLDIATQIAADAYLLTRDDAQREIAKRKREIQQLERLSGSKLIVEAGTIITCYHTDPRERRRISKTYRRYQ